MTEPYSLQDILRDSAKLHDRLQSCVHAPLSTPSDRGRVSQGLSRVAFEHAAGILELTVCCKYTSAVGLLRLQYEALVRSTWIYYAASDSAISRLMSSDPDRPSEKLPMLGQMIDELDERAPTTLVTSFREFREYSWKPLSSYVHSGAHSLLWSESGFPGWLIAQTVRSSNGLVVFTGLHLADLAGDRRLGLQVLAATDGLGRALPANRPAAGEGSPSN